MKSVNNSLQAKRPPPVSYIEVPSSTMADPFEFPLQSYPTAPSTLRESSIQQTINFLNDPRVKNADPAAALEFLRKKDITEDEIREAYRRCGLTFPSSSANQFTHPNPSVPPPYLHPGQHLVPFQPPPPSGPSWVSVFLGITTAAGIYTALREVLRRYVVPLYFPEAARIAEERRRRDQMTMQAQELQITELRDRIEELVESSKKTNEQVKTLTQSISSSLAMRERELTQSSDLRNAIRQLSHSVSASGGTDTSRLMKEEEPMGSTSEAGYLRFLKGRHTEKHGSLAYGHVEHFNGITAGSGSGESKEPIGTPGTNVIIDGEEGREATSSNILKEKQQGEESEDEFMSIKPADVEDSWGGGWSNGIQGYAEKDDVAKQDGGTEDRTEDRTENGAENGTENAAEERREIIEEVDADVGEDIAAESRGMNGGSFFGGSSGTATQTARELFQAELLNEAKNVFGGVSKGLGESSQSDGKRPRGRPLSMPTMDVPLSDDD